MNQKGTTKGKNANFLTYFRINHWVTWLVLGIGLRLIALGNQSLWLDEVLNAHDATVPFHQMPQVILASPPFFHVVVRLFYIFFGFNDFWLRFPSALFGILLIPAFYYVVKSLLNKESALWGVALLCVAPFHVAYSQELRMYSLIPLEALGTFYFLECALKNNNYSDWFWFGLCSLLGLYTHNWFPFLLICEVAAFLLTAKSREQLKNGCFCFFVICLLYLPWLPFLKIQLMRPVYTFLRKPGWDAIRETVYAFAGIRVPSGVSWIGVGRDARLPLLFVSLALLLRGLLRSGEERARTVRIFLYACIGPLTIAFLISILFKPIYLAGRYTILAFPAYLFVVSRALSDPNNSVQKLCRFGAICWMVLLSRPLYYYYVNYEKAPFKLMAAYINTKAEVGERLDISALSGEDRLCLFYYLSSSMPIIDNPKDVLHGKILALTTTERLPISEQVNCQVLEKKNFKFGRVDLLGC